MHRIVAVLQQIGAGLLAEAVLIHAERSDSGCAPRFVAERGSTRYVSSLS
jgi:hypothetical protein